MKIGVDFDQILCDFMTPLIEFHNDRYGTKLKLQDFFSYDFWKVWGGTRDEAIDKVYDFHGTKYFKEIKPIKDSQCSLKKLKENNELFVITSKQDVFQEETRNWIECEFPGIFSEIYFTNHYSKTGKEKSKKVICDSLGIDLMIEDSLVYSEECVSSKRKVFLLDNPWNKSEYLPAGIVRVSSWKEIVDKIDKLKILPATKLQKLALR